MRAQKFLIPVARSLFSRFSFLDCLPSHSSLLSPSLLSSHKCPNFGDALSILTAIIGLKLAGQTINTMTLGEIALAVGMLVDDATVEIENIHRNRAMDNVLLVAILDGASQIATPTLVGTLCICIVFFPVNAKGLRPPARLLPPVIPIGVRRQGSALGGRPQGSLVRLFHSPPPTLAISW
jgi:hypothetical protein